MGFGSCQDKDNIGWWFFKGLEQGIGGIGAKHVDFVYDVDLVASLVGRIIDPLTQATDIINTSVAGGINFNDIQGFAFIGCLAHGAGVAWFTLAIVQAIYRLSQNTASAGLASSSRTTKEIGMRYLAAGKGIE